MSVASAAANSSIFICTEDLDVAGSGEREGRMCDSRADDGCNRCSCGVRAKINNMQLQILRIFSLRPARCVAFLFQFNNAAEILDWPHIRPTVIRAATINIMREFIICFGNERAGTLSARRTVGTHLRAAAKCSASSAAVS